MKFPKHLASLTLSHNEHTTSYQTVKEYLTYPWMEDADWASEEEKQLAIDNNEVWELQWYPDTPIGFYKVCGYNLDVVLQAALDIEASYRLRD